MWSLLLDRNTQNEGKKMISEFVIGAGVVWSWNTWKNRDVQNVKKVFNDLIAAKGKEYEIVEARKDEYGYILIVSLYGCGFEDLEKMQDLISSTYGATIQITQNDNIKTATIYIITEKLTDDYKFQLVKVQPYELYIGKTYTMKDIILNMRELPHLLTTGINSSGKTFAVITALTNLIYYNNERVIEIYLSQISAKKDLRKFSNVKQCRGYATNIQQSYEMFKYLYHIIEKRIGIFNSSKDGFVDDIYEWNKAYPMRKMRIIILAMDEFTSYQPDSNDNQSDREIKEKCMDLLIKIIQQSRCVGMYILTSLQRSDKESISPRIKAQFNCKISFKQSNIASSLVTTDSDKAFHLKPKRECIVNADSEYLVKTLYLDNDMVKEFLKPSIDEEFPHKNYYNYVAPVPIKEVNQSKPIENTGKSTKKSKSKVKVVK
jgi:S-DNA-T family DNA segregation ATPase FtsK/SpoIIIE